MQRYIFTFVAVVANMLSLCGRDTLRLFCLSFSLSPSLHHFFSFSLSHSLHSMSLSVYLNISLSQSSFFRISVLTMREEYLKCMANNNPNRKIQYHYFRYFDKGLLIRIRSKIDIFLNTSLNV